MVSGSIHQNRVRLGIENLFGKQFQIRAAADYRYAARGQEILQTAASERRRCDDENASHAATAFFPAAREPSCTVTRRRRSKSPRKNSSRKRRGLPSARAWARSWTE